MPPSAQSGPAKRLLGAKESSLFKELLNLYETRQLKKGLKTADLILKKHPEHGETLCMKGLVLVHLGRREEGVETVKRGMRYDLMSHICWHVFGLIQKGEKNYEEALKSYNQALRFDKENINILRDTAHLHAQLRNFDSLVDIRHTLLRIRPNLRQNWVALAVAYHLNGCLNETKKVLEHYEVALKNIPDYDVEHSEVLLYHIRVLEELDETQEALNVLDVSAKDRTIIDRTAIMEYRARILSKLKHDDAEHAWQALIEQNPDCYLYYRGFFSHRGINLDTITDENREETLKYLHDFSTQHTRAAAPRRIALDVAKGDDFRSLVDKYINSALEKGIPSLFSDLKALYHDIPKRDAIEEIVEACRQKLTPPEIQPPSGTPDDEGTSDAEPPTTYLWTLYFLAQHYSHISQHSHALSLLEIAIQHTPTLPELFTCKARVLKRLGDPWGAAKAMDDARVMDLQDRFLNTKCAKYRLRASQEEEAQEVFGLFTKKDAPSPGSDLEDMQSLLFLTEDGDCHRRIGHLGFALKRYHGVQKLFHEIEDDQFDFHGYSLRRFTINSYLDLIPWEDRARTHPAYVQSAVGAAQIWVQLHDDPSLVKKSTPSAQLTEAEKKEKRRKTKKAAHQKVQEEVKKATNANSSNEDKGLEPPPPKDDDPDGSKLLQAEDGLARAAKFLAPLITLETTDIDVWIAIYDVAVRRQKYLQAVQALAHVKALDAEHPELHIRLVHFRKTVSSLPQQPPEPVGPVLASTWGKVFPTEVSIETYNSQYLQKHSSSPRAILAAAKALRILDTPPTEVVETTFQLLKPEVSPDVSAGLAALSFLQDVHPQKAEEFRLECEKKFELSTVFKSPKEQALLRTKAFATFDIQEEGQEDAQNGVKHE